MIFDSVTNGSPAPETCRKENALVGIVQPNGNGNIGKFVRRRRMELCRVKEKCAGQQGIISGEDIYTKKRRSASVTCRSHGSISVIGRRREMEDAVTLELRFLKKGLKSYDFFGVYDGHGGSLVARACHEMLHGLLLEIARVEGGEEIDWKKVMVESFKKMDEEVNKNGEVVATTGSTAVVAVVGEEEVVVAHCGDSRAVISRGGVAVQLSDDHKVHDMNNDFRF